MKTFNATFILCAALALSGCATGGGLDRAKINQTIEDVRATATSLCSFTPTVDTVSAILGAMGVPGVAVAGEVANRICDAVVRRSGAALPVVVVNGKRIPVRGTYQRVR